MDPNVVSEAVVLWSGKGRYAWPHPDDSRVLDQWGDALGRDLVSQVHVLRDDFYESDARHVAHTLQEMGQLAAQRFRSLHPDLSSNAVEALMWCYTFDFK